MTLKFVNMAVGGGVGDFENWLSDKLQAYNTDEGVYSSYIKGILEGEESTDEKKEALEGIFSEMTEDNITVICQEIMEKWHCLTIGEHNNSSSEVAEDMDVKLARLIESQAQATTVRTNNLTDEEKRIRESILMQYGQMSDDEGEAAPHPPTVGTTQQTKAHLERNTNATLVMQAEREKREQAKLESQKKKEKDKEDREKQKQMQQEKKEKRKPQKGERRR